MIPAVKLRMLIAMLGILFGASSGLGQGKSEVRLLVEASEVRPGSSFIAAIELTSPTGWHTYWRNPGDSGQATKIEWTLPDGFTAGEILWPTPEKLTEAGLTTYVYHGGVLLPVRIQVAANRASGPAEISARVSWLECLKECIPGRTTARAKINVGNQPTASADSPTIEQALSRLPLQKAAASANASWEGPTTGDQRYLTVTVPTPGLLDFFPYQNSDAEIASTEQVVLPAGDGSTLKLSVTKTGASWPTQIVGLLQFAGSKEGQRSTGEVTLTISDTPTSTTAGQRALVLPVTGGSLLRMLGLAFLGGMILNIMPCVLPVIALKILGFVKQSRENPRRVRTLGLVYTAGVLVSFAVLAGLIIGVQMTGKSASWGMQFQNPVFLVAITTLVTLVALNLFGVFEVNLAADAMGAASGLASREGASGAFFNGVFTTVLATPCTAPFLGVSLGFAFSQPPALLLLLFLAAGAGLAGPYLLLSMQPSWLRFLPKPGNWMITFKMLMGFPMLATALWLLSLAPDHFGEGAVFWLGLFLVLISLAAWLYGRFIQVGQGNPAVAWAAIAAAVLAGYVGILELQLNWRTPPGPQVGGFVTKPGGIPWQAWSSAAVAKARSEGRPVLVDFTAKWCLTCQANKKTAIEIPSVRTNLIRLNFATFLGDFTLEDPAIAAEFPKFGRAGVPLVLVYPRNPALPPRVLPELLTPSIVLEALEWAAE